MDSTSSRKIEVFVHGTEYLLFDFEGYKYLRCEKRIVGCPFGQVTAYKQQVLENTVPVTLSREEVGLCLEQGWIELRQSRNQTQLAEKAMNSFKKRKISSIYDGDSDDEDEDIHEEVEEQQKTNGSQQLHCSNEDDNDNDDVDESWKQQIAKNLLIQIPLTGSSEKAELRPPSSKFEAMKCAVFKDLHSKGYYLTNGAKFGVEYLVYSGEPQVYHSSFSVKVVEERNNLNLILLAGLMRATQSTRKHLLLAFVSQTDESDDLDVSSYSFSYISSTPESGQNVNEADQTLE
eukprot:TRINITY_DN71365_c0_g1_i2.p1 TRINITY_DN71365_c0_g1~~TRINITY_DN71365_c0_g1_i2.p1  ORF type:complete len:316 (-),score=36.31 TRINITY_DN71365_c0_g1_i2:229-1098(-)